MADISLREYLNNLDTLLENEAYGEVIYHCHHILQHFPKNLATYRRLGLALTEGTSQLDESIEVWRRVLSVVPVDKSAHLHLGRVYQRAQRPDEAIWHIERAYEQDTGNQLTAGKLRELYKEYRDVDQARLPLSTGAVAQQYVRNQLHDQAIDVLSQTLAEDPKRVDLRLLLVRTLYEMGNLVEAAEAALDLLEMLPDCLEANFILTELWLAEERPSDAQRYLSRIEDVDPYFALELAQGSPPDDDVFQLPEADYQAEASRQLTEANPDWLVQIDDVDDIDFMDEAISDNTILDTALGIQDADDAEQDWLDEFESLHESSMKPTSVLPAIDIPEKEPPRRRKGLTGLLGPVPDEELESEIEGALTGDDDLDISELFAEDAAEDLMDAVDWMQGEVPEVIEEVDDDAEDPLAWMQETGVELADEVDVETAAESVVPGSDQEDPLAWIQQDEIELLADDEIVSEFQDPYGLEDEMILQDPDSVDPLAWMQGTGAELAESEVADDEEDPLAWLQDSGVELVGDESDTVISDVLPEVAHTIQFEQPDTPDDADSLGWLDDDSVLDEILDLESLTDESVFH